MPVQLQRGPGRWVAFVAAILVSMVSSGSGFLFPLYSKAIKTSLGYDNKALTMLAFAKNLGGSLGFLPSALIYDAAPPRAVLPFVAAMNLLGVVAYLVPFLAASGSGRMRSIGRPAVSMLVCVSVAVGANSQSFAMTGALVSSVSNFPGHRGHVMTLLLAFAGLGGDILAQFGRASEDVPALLLLVPCLCCFLLLLFTWISIRVVTPPPAGAARSGVERRGVMHFLGVSIFPGASLLTIFHAVDLVVSDLPRNAHYATAIVVGSVLVLSLFIVAVNKESEEASARGFADHVFALGSNNPNPTRPPPPSILRAVFSVDMLLIFSITFAIGGGVQTAIDMMDQIAQSLGYKHSATSKLVSLVSLVDYAGRLVGGFVSEYVVANYKLPRPLVLIVVFLVATFGYLLIALGVANGLYAAAAMMGFNIGALWTVVFVTISEVFGTEHLAVLYNVSVLPSAVGAYILNAQLMARLYAGGDKAQQQHHTCATVRCFRESFFILVGVTLFGAAVSAVLAWRAWKSFYRAPTPIAAAAAAVGAAPVVVTADDPGSSQVEPPVSSIKLEVVAMDVESFV